MKHLLILPFIFLFLPQHSAGQTAQKNFDFIYLRPTETSDKDLLIKPVTTMKEEECRLDEFKKD